MVLELFGGSSGPLLDPLLGLILGPILGSKVAPFWVHFWSILAPFWAHFCSFPENLDFRAANPEIPFLFGLGPSPRPGG